MNQTATLLNNGLVLIAGGRVLGLSDLDAAELYDPAANKFTPTTVMTAARFDDTATLLRDGRVLIAGGSPGLDSAEVYDPAKGTFSKTPAPMTTGRFRQTATLLADGEVLIAGGSGSPGSGGSAELFRP
jgi:hypothetical protein